MLPPLRTSLLLALAFATCPTAQAAVTRTKVSDVHEQLPVYCWQDSELPCKAVVLCLHGFPMHGLTFDRLATELAGRGFAVYAPDMRALGANSHCDRLAYTTDTDSDIASIAATLRKRHKRLKLFVCGESMGGSFGLRLAAKNPDLLDGLIVSGPGLSLSRHYLRLVPAGLLSIVVRTERVDFSGQLREFFSADPRIVREILADPLVRRDFRVVELLQPKVIAAQTVELLPDIRAALPVLALQDRDDRMCRDEGVDIMRRKMRTEDLTVRYFKRRGHVLLETQYVQKEAVAEITSWLEKRVD